MNYPNLARIFMTLAIVFFSTYLIKVGAADFLRLEPCDYLDQVHEKNVRPSPVRLAEAKERLLLAQRFDPKNPVIAEYLALATFYRATLSDFDVHLQHEFFAQAMEEYQAAVNVRPNSGYLWGAIMQTQQALIETAKKPDLTSGEGVKTTPEDLKILNTAMTHAVQLSPWESVVIHQVINIGYLHYAEIGDGERKLVDAAIERAKMLQLKSGTQR